MLYFCPFPDGFSWFLQLSSLFLYAILFSEISCFAAHLPPPRCVYRWTGFSYSSNISNLGLSVRWVYDIKGVLGAKPPAQDEKGGGVGGGNALWRAAEAARKLAITKNIRANGFWKNPLAHSNFLAPTGARRGVFPQAAPRTNAALAAFVGRNK